MKDYFLGSYYVTSHLEACYQDALEDLFYFNRNQSRIDEALRDTVARYGSPQIRRDGDHLALELATTPQAQALYVLIEGHPPGLVGVMIYAREGSLLRVLYVGLDPEHAYKEGMQGYLLVELFAILRAIGRRIRGIEAVEFTTGHRNLRLAV